MSTWLLVLAGGSGTRFWPRSRANFPKQLMPIVGEKALLNVTLERFQGVVDISRQVVLTTKALEPAVQKSLLGSKVTLLCEPEARNTAPCIVMAMEWIRAKDPAAVVILVPADHWITDLPEYLRVMKLAVDAASKTPHLYTIGIQPTKAETGYGYIRCGDRLSEEIFSVDRFVEKPSKEVAETMVQSPEYLWNAGMFVWSIASFFHELSSAAPEYEKIFSGYRAELSQKKSGELALSTEFAKAPAISIDYALLEKSKMVAVVPGQKFGWNDLGSFASLDEVYPPVEGGVARAAQVLAVDSVANVIDCPGKTVALLGVTDMIIVDTGDVILVAAKERAQEVKQFVERLKKNGQKGLI